MSAPGEGRAPPRSRSPRRRCPSRTGPAPGSGRCRPRLRSRRRPSPSRPARATAQTFDPAARGGIDRSAGARPARPRCRVDRLGDRLLAGLDVRLGRQVVLDAAVLRVPPAHVACPFGPFVPGGLPRVAPRETSTARGSGPRRLGSRRWGSAASRRRPAGAPSSSASALRSRRRCSARRRGRSARRGARRRPAAARRARGR